MLEFLAVDLEIQNRLVDRVCKHNQMLNQIIDKDVQIIKVDEKTFQCLPKPVEHDEHGQHRDKK